MSSLLSLTMVAESLRIAAPYACAAAGGVWAERAGVVQIGLEGVLLTSAFASVAAAHATGSATAGLLAGLAINARVPKEAMSVVEAVVIVLVAVAARFPASRPGASAPAAETPAKEASA